LNQPTLNEETFREMAEQDSRERRHIGLVPRAPEVRDRRRQLPTVVRYMIIAFFGLIVAVLASYLLRSIGF
jgi:hypothetical protein